MSVRETVTVLSPVSGESKVLTAVQSVPSVRVISFVPSVKGKLARTVLPSVVPS